MRIPLKDQSDSLVMLLFINAYEIYSNGFIDKSYVFDNVNIDVGVFYPQGGAVDTSYKV